MVTPLRVCGRLERLRILLRALQMNTLLRVVGPPLESLRGERSSERAFGTCETVLSTCSRCPGPSPPRRCWTGGWRRRRARTRPSTSSTTKPRSAPTASGGTSRRTSTRSASTGPGQGSKRVRHSQLSRFSVSLESQLPILSFTSSYGWDRGDQLSSRSRTMDASSEKLIAKHSSLSDVEAPLSHPGPGSTTSARTSTAR